MEARAEKIEAVRTLNSIEQVISEHVRLRRSGAQFVGRCPFHADKTPSFSVNPARRVFYCHGCQVGGDVFEFVRLVHHCTFPESVKILAARAGMRIEGFRPSPELKAKVASIQAHRSKELSFKRFCDERIDAIGRQYRALGRAATHAEEFLQSGITDPYLHNLAWSALERFRTFELRIEREGLCDLDIIKTEWSKSAAA